MFLAWLVILWWAAQWTSDRLPGLWASTRAAPPAAYSLDELRWPTAGAYLGIFFPGVPEDMGLLRALESRMRVSFPLISLYTAWGSHPDQQFNPAPLNRILAHGAIPVLTWEPWVTDFARAGLPPMPDRQFRSLQAIARGDYDFYIEAWADAARRWDRPLMIRLGHEMNATWYPWGERAFGNTAEDYVRMWRHVVGVFRQRGATNVIWVWSPARRPLHHLYPGDEWVDWVAMTLLNFGTVPPGWKWESFADMFDPYYPELSRHGKPIMIAEVASAEVGGSKAQWIYEAMGSLPARFPAVRAFMWFNQAQDRYWPINWSLTSSRDAADAFRRAAADPYFITQPR